MTAFSTPAGCRRLPAACALAAWVAMCSFLGAAGGAGEALKIRVTPAIAQPPAFVTIRADVEAHEDNRALEITAESDMFFTSSRVPLEGEKGPRFSEVHFDNLPEGAYTVKVVLVGNRGTRASATRRVLVGSATVDDPL